MECAICKEEIPSRGGWDQGNNAEPVNDGRCCDDCNWNVVIPARMNILYLEELTHGDNYN